MLAAVAQSIFCAMLAMGLLLARIEPANAATPDNTELSAKIAALQKEACGLKQQSKTASPEELKQIDKRAGELLDQLRALGLPVPQVAPRVPRHIGNKATIKTGETAVGDPPEPGGIGPGARALSNKPNKPASNIGDEVQTSMIRNKTGGKTAIAKLTPQYLEPRLVINDINRTNTLMQLAGEAFDVVFSLRNTGGATSVRTSYSISCQALRGGADCPFNRKSGALSPIAAGKSGEITLKGLKLRAGEYELTLKIDSGISQIAKLKVAAAAGVKPEAATGGPQRKLNRDIEIDERQQLPRLRLP